jgi:CBS-domain-containing membrane protein
MTAVHTRNETVADVMTERPVTVGPETTVREILAVMESHGISSCPVVKPSGELCGIVSQVDVLRAFRPSRELALLTLEGVASQRAREVMRYGVVSLEPEDPLVAALDLLVDSRLHTLPVVRRGPGRPVVVGLISQSDVIRHLVHPSPGAG